MIKDTTREVLARNFNKTASIKWFSVGVTIGILGWIWGSSQLPVWALSIASGFGWLLVALSLLATVLASVALLATHRIGRLAHGAFSYVMRWGHPKLLRATSVFYGVAVIAIVCWGVTGSRNPFVTALDCVFLATAMLWCWAGLAVIGDELAKRFSASAT